jgi:hypothetical protein
MKSDEILLFMLKCVMERTKGLAHLPQLPFVFKKNLWNFSVKPSDFKPHLSENHM